MQAATLGQYGNLDFVFLDLKQHSSSLDKEILKDLKKLEKLINNALNSRKKLDSELHLISPQLFSLRIKALDWLTKGKQDINSVLDEVYPSIEQLGENPRLKKVGYHIAQSLTYNRKLVSFFSDAGVLSDKSMESVSMANFDYSSFVIALQFMPSQISRLLMGIMNASLKIEFISIAAIMLSNNEIKCSDLKVLQLTTLASNTALEYIGYVNHLLTMAQTEMFLEEKSEWSTLSAKAFASAYSDKEPDYESITLREANPEYHK